MDAIRKLEKLDKLSEELGKEEADDILGRPKREFAIALVRKDGCILGIREKTNNECFRMPGVEIKPLIKLGSIRYHTSHQYALACELRDGYGILADPNLMGRYGQTDWIPEEDCFKRLTFYEVPEGTYKVRRIMFTRPKARLGEIPEDEVLKKLGIIKRI